MNRIGDDVFNARKILINLDQILETKYVEPGNAIKNRHTRNVCVCNVDERIILYLLC